MPIGDRFDAEITDVMSQRPMSSCGNQFTTNASPMSAWINAHRMNFAIVPKMIR
jgi:hypothetical protein